MPPQPQPRSGRINIQRAPQVHIQRSVPNSVRFASFLNNHIHNPISRPPPPPATTSTSASSEATPTPSNYSAPTINLDDAQLNTLIPLFGTSDVQLQVRDLINVTPPPSTLNRIRSELREFIMSKLRLSSTSDEENIAMVNILFTASIPR